MPKFHLQTQGLVQGHFELKEVNFAFVFQVNCPGCFLYAIPQVNDLYLKYGDSVGFIGVSTAFEDFELNTEDNLVKLLQQKVLVGETARHYQETFGLSTYDHPVLFPVAFDKLFSASEFLNEEHIDKICNLNPNYSIWPASEQQNMKDVIIAHYRNYDKIAATFTLNQLRGTPSFIIFDKNYWMLDMSFGYQEQHSLEEKLKSYLST